MGGGRHGAKSYPNRNHAVEHEAAQRVWLGGLPGWLSEQQWKESDSSGRDLIPSYLLEKEMHFLE